MLHIICRWVSLGGSLLAFTGMTLSAFMPSLETLFLTLGLLTGAGVGLATTPGIILTARYFDKRRSRANALCLSGAAAGAFTLPVFFTFLLDTYGFHRSLPVIGACLLHICISAALYRSVIIITILASQSWCFDVRPLAVHVQILRKEESQSESKGQIAEVVENGHHQNGKIEGFSTPVTNGHNVNGGEVTTLSRNGSIRGNPLSCSNPVTIPVNSCIQQLRHSEGSESAGSPRSREGSTPRFHCGSMESDFVLSKAPHSIHSSFDSISMMSSVSMEKLASKVQGAEAPIEVLRRSGFLWWLTIHPCRWPPGAGTTLDIPTMEGSTNTKLVVMESNNRAVTGLGGPLPPTAGWESQGIQNDYLLPFFEWLDISSFRYVLPSTAKSLSLRELAIHQIGSHLSLYKWVYTQISFQSYPSCPPGIFW